MYVPLQTFQQCVLLLFDQVWCCGVCARGLWLWAAIGVDRSASRSVVLVTSGPAASTTCANVVMLARKRAKGQVFASKCWWCLNWWPVTGIRLKNQSARPMSHFSGTPPTGIYTPTNTPSLRDAPTRQGCHHSFASSFFTTGENQKITFLPFVRSKIINFTEFNSIK
jgi:hypothetical protein